MGMLPEKILYKNRKRKETGSEPETNLSINASIQCILCTTKLVFRGVFSELV